MQQLQNLIMRESRLQRLQRATKRGEIDAVCKINQELIEIERSEALVNTKTQRMELARPKSITWPVPPCPNRAVFLSITELERAYQGIPRDVLEPAIFIFDAERSWVFLKHNRLQKESFDYQYMAYEKDFLDMLVFKEEAKLLFWFQV
jgi:hypothetical protein